LVALAGGYKAGDQVIVEQGGELYEAKIVSADKGGFKVSYKGYDEEETVTAARIKAAVKTGGPWKANDKVLVEQGNKIFAAKIVSAEADNKFKVAYDGYDEQETVPADRIRAPLPKGGIKLSGGGGAAASSGASDAPCPGPGITRRCNGVCVNLQEDDKNCGACGSVCREGYHCDGHLFCRDASGGLQ
jgi:hypothetical protein